MDKPDKDEFDKLYNEAKTRYSHMSMTELEDMLKYYEQEIARVKRNQMLMKLYKDVKKPYED